MLIELVFRVERIGFLLPEEEKHLRTVAVQVTKEQLLKLREAVEAAMIQNVGREE